ncbi:WS/DGAT domain-containing protein [Paraconexibacter antarcticus]|uniref:diacylglycerol O-acyltransferase n=1 Tax=Paraconexibacter antarcticus TaxID=2949664 RepID=A0ABY5DXN4_9ACTN|nr:wax ester/triacylglycerol synthase domain-containing protein [Paraconexibacter antarcticus]UTI65400.1 WS/DGAT domain-containing protein [Paraconexibacter antarcticus]
MATGIREDGVLDWGAGNALNPLETVMWRAEVDPTLNSTVLALEILDRSPDWPRFRAAHEWGCSVVPRFRQRVVDGPAGLGQPIWVVDPRFDLDHHVRRVVLPDGSTYRDMLDRVQAVATVPFDRSRPPWQAILLEGLPDGRAAYALKMHHATLDGMAGMQLLGGLHSRQREPTKGKKMPPPPAAGSTSSLAVVTRQAGKDVGGLVGLARSAPGRLLRIGRPDRAARDLAAYVASLRRVLGDSGAEPSPLLTGRSHDWHFGMIDLKFKDLRAAAKVADASLNDAFLAALLGGFRRYHEQLGVPIRTMPFAMPISVRKEGETGGNAFAAARLAGPVGEKDPVKRMKILGKAVRAVREEPALNGVGAMAPALARLPGPVIAQLAGSLTKANDLQASNVPGIREEVFLAGAKVERMYGYAPLPGCAAMIVLFSHADLCCVAVNLDPAAITEPERFGRCLVEGFGEVLDLVPGAEPAVWQR